MSELQHETLEQAIIALEILAARPVAPLTREMCLEAVAELRGYLNRHLGERIVPEPEV